MGATVEKDTYYVYRVLDVDNNVLYVGKTNCIQRRMQFHRCNKKAKVYWFSMVDRIEYITVNSPYKAAILEIHYISLYKPKYNKFCKHHYIDLFSFPVYDWKQFSFKHIVFERQGSMTVANKKYAVKYLVELIHECAQNLYYNRRTVAKNDLLLLEPRLHALSKSKKTDLWNTPEIKQLVSDNVIELRGRTVKFL